LPKGVDPVTIEVREVGYLPFTTRLVPSDDQRVEAQLEPARTTPAPAPPPPKRVPQQKGRDVDKVLFD
jgi:hypothetical protein